jgi:hypothetical protein
MQNVIVWCVEFFETLSNPVVQCGLDVNVLPFNIYLHTACLSCVRNAVDYAIFENS